jgi:hypothetical protein
VLPGLLSQADVHPSAVPSGYRHLVVVLARLLGALFLFVIAALRRRHSLCHVATGLLHHQGALRRLLPGLFTPADLHPSTVPSSHHHHVLLLLLLLLFIAALRRADVLCLAHAGLQNHPDPLRRVLPGLFPEAVVPPAGVPRSNPVLLLVPSRACAVNHHALYPDNHGPAARHHGRAARNHDCAARHALDVELGIALRWQHDLLDLLPDLPGHHHHLRRMPAGLLPQDLLHAPSLPCLYLFLLCLLLLLLQLRLSDRPPKTVRNDSSLETRICIAEVWHGLGWIVCGDPV